MGNLKEKELKVEIRKVTPKDVYDWCEILRQSVENIYSQYISREYMNKNYHIERLKENFLQEVSKSNTGLEMYMLTVNGISVGILKIGKPVKYYTDGKNYYRENMEGIGEIKSLHIKSEYQGQGIGKQAIFFAEGRLKELNYERASIWVKIQNTKAVNFYRSRGYQKTNYINANTNDGAVSMVMEKMLK